MSIYLSSFCLERFCQILLTVGSLLYGGWFAFVYLSAFHWHLDAQSSIALLFVGIYSLPIMIPIWLVSATVHRRRLNKN
ncbi:hypothetical protein [Roseibacillus ishigakijimensis]|uniref:Uncharacterized protein n=1 Tax=Roseibacillus ishigakijimensis TaxID=454146 RepID=A0A934RLT4_9BACT|nr:hypothetical protein [Roseibacillus ishigakijimensis]MBK1834112.1 hypothetical protein [Roseibacillus ishigakijimensis]